MTTEQIRQMLRQLHQELEHTSTLDESSKPLLEDVKKDIEKLLSQSGANLQPSTANQPDLVDRLENAVYEFEESHPKLVYTIRPVIDGLRNIGFK